MRKHQVLLNQEMELYDQKLVIAHYEKFQEYLEIKERLDQEINRAK